MRLESLELQNFLSFGPAQILSLDRLGLVLVEGQNRDDAHTRSNGAGKSTLAEAIFWCLFGVTLRGGLRGDAVINERVGKDCFVRLRGTHQDQRFEVVRARKHSTWPCPLVLRIADQDRTAGNDSAQTQRRLQQFLQVTPEVFLHTVVFGQGSAWRFSELNDADRKALLDRLVGTARLGRAHAFCKQRSEALERAVGNKKQELLMVRTQRQAQKELYAQLKASRRTYVAEQRQRLQGELAAVQAQQEDLPAEEPQTQRVRALVESAQGQYDAAVEVLAAHRAEASQANAQEAAASTALQKFETLPVGERCQRCGARLKAERLAKRGRKLKRQQVAADRRCAEAQATCRQQAADVAKLRQALSTAQNDLRDTERCLAQYEQAKATQAGLTAQRQRLEAQLDKLKTPQPSDAEAHAQAEAARLKGLVTTLKAEAAQAEDMARHMRFWVEGFGAAGVQSHLLDHVVPHLNRHAQRVAQQLASDLRVEFQTQKQLKGGGVRDKFTLSVTNAHGATDYAGQSQGEKRKVDIVVALALQNLVQGSSRCNVAIWDEVTDGLDEASAEAVMGLLRAQGKERDTTLVISHAAWLQAHFAHTLRVIKENGSSRLEQLSVT